MDRHETIKNAGLSLAVGLVLVLLMVTPLMAEYTNEAVTDPNDPAYWVDRGGLYATYGSYAAAVKAYNKALAINANNSKAYFNRGLAYAEMGDFNAALADINKAISIDPVQENYYYGRGRVMLLSGKKDEALKDFKKAAGMGDKDAIKYLHRPN